MEQTRYAGRMRYLDATDVQEGVVNFDGLDVRGPDDRKLGDIDGFIVDATSGRIHYAVVDSGGWFRSRRFLVPIGHATVDRDRHALRVDLSSDALNRYPEFDEERFREFSDEELRNFENRTAAACCPEDALQDVSVGGSYYETRRHYQQPAWWRGSAYDRERLRPVESGAYDTSVAAGTRPPVREQGTSYTGEEIRALGRDDLSPHQDGRAQPGDVLGIETGGERTYIGDTEEEENTRRRTAEDTVRDEEPPRTRG